MKVKKITVNKLFGTFSHSIDMRMAERITIIHGPNGFGKTAVLRLTDALFNGRRHELRSIPFKSFQVEFTDESKLEVVQTKVLRDKNPNRIFDGTSLTYKYKAKGDKRSKSYMVESGDEKLSSQYPLNAIEDYIFELERIGTETWRSSNGEILYLDDVLEKYADSLPFPVPMDQQPEWLKTVLSSIDVHLVQTQRLLSVPKVKFNSRGRYDKRPTMALAVAEFSDELVKSIQAKLSEYAALSQSLDRSFPARLVKEEAPDTLTKQQLREKLNNLEKRRSQLMAAGLLDSKQSSEFQIPQEIQDRTIDVLSVYVRDVDTKLSVFNEIAARIDLFKAIINSRFLYKKMEVTREHGFRFTTREGKPLAATSLSSGEQHELVLFYALLFKVKPDSLIMIDEPEISLHVAWQKQFLKDLQRITELSSFDILIATHSPQIIHNRWDLTVELKGPTK